MANHNNNKDKDKNLYYLDELSDYKVSNDDPDVTGWEVKDADNRVIGKVDNLLVNKRTERVVYLDVEVDKTIIEADHDPYGQPANADVHEFINKEGENHIIIPIGLVSLNEDQKFVYTDRINHQTFAETKRIQKGHAVNREYEVVVLDSYERDYRDDRDRDRDSVTRSGDRRNDDTRRDANFDSDRDRSRINRDRDLDRDRDYTGRDKGRLTDDDDFYDRREFDRTNYRRRK